MAERDARVLACGAFGVRLRLVAGECRGCRIGCSGRCNVFADAADLELTLSPPPGRQPQAGEAVVLQVDEEALRRAAFAGYGMALLGLLGGALVGFALAFMLGLPRDPATLAGLVAGTVWMLRRSKRHRLQPRIQQLAPDATHPH